MPPLSPGFPLVRAATMIRSAVPPSSTKVFLPFSITLPLPPSVPASAIFSGA